MRHVPAVLALALTSALLATPASAEGFNLDGRVAPDLVFTTTNGVVPAGTRLSDLRGKVVVLRFWLRDCPICKRVMPQAQDMHARWKNAGLVVVTVLHQHPPTDPVLQQYMRQNGFDFGVVTDASGQLAQAYGVRNRPTDYLIGVDGRIKASNTVPPTVLSAELGKWRLQQLGTVPSELMPAREHVWRLEHGNALRLVEAAAKAEGASAEVVQSARRFEAVAKADLEARHGWASTLARRGNVADARAEYDALAQEYRGTALEERAKTLRSEFLARSGG
jgi:peroxiredoxin